MTCIKHIVCDRLKSLNPFFQQSLFLPRNSIFSASVPENYNLFHPVSAINTELSTLLFPSLKSKYILKQFRLFFTEHTEGRKGVLHLKNVPSIFANQDYYLEIFVCFFREYIPSISGCHASRFRQNEQILFLFSLRARGKGPFVLGNTHLLGGQASQKKTAFLSLCLYRKRGKDECKALRSFEKGHKMSLFLHT